MRPLVAMQPCSMLTLNVFEHCNPGFVTTLPTCASLHALDRQVRTAFGLQQIECRLPNYWTFDGMEILDAVESLDDVLKLKCHKAIAAVQRTLDLYGCAACA